MLSWPQKGAFRDYFFLSFLSDDSKDRHPRIIAFIWRDRLHTIPEWMNQNALRSSALRPTTSARCEPPTLSRVRKFCVMWWCDLFFKWPDDCPLAHPSLLPTFSAYVVRCTPWRREKLMFDFNDRKPPTRNKIISRFLLKFLHIRVRTSHHITTSSSSFICTIKHKYNQNRIKLDQIK